MKTDSAQSIGKHSEVIWIGRWVLSSCCGHSALVFVAYEQRHAPPQFRDHVAHDIRDYLLVVHVAFFMESEFHTHSAK
jgi:hypothetical protein